MVLMLMLTSEMELVLMVPVGLSVRRVYVLC